MALPASGAPSALLVTCIQQTGVGLGAGTRECAGWALVGVSTGGVGEVSCFLRSATSLSVAFLSYSDNSKCVFEAFFFLFSRHACLFSVYYWLGFRAISENSQALFFMEEVNN